MIQNAKRQILSLQEGCLLALSGGPDSMCLLALLLECRKPFHIAHIDHGLRAESGDEKTELESFANKHKIPFHCLKLEGIKQGNLEETLRNSRLDFFKKVMQEHHLKVLLLGHQQDEQGETIIKRFFEGGCFTHLQGMKQKSELRGMLIVRPLIHTPKSAVIAYLEKREMFYFIDPTNLTTSNLRGKMRVNLLPLLEKEFGKSIGASVCDVGEQIEDLSSYLDEMIASQLKSAVPGFCGTFYPYCKGSEYIYKMMIFHLLNELGVTLSRDDRLVIKRSVTLKIAGKKKVFGDRILFFEKEGIFIIDEIRYKTPFVAIESGISWVEFWQGGGEMDVETESIKQLNVSEYHRIHKTPICLRNVYPIPLTTITKKIKVVTTNAKE